MHDQRIDVYISSFPYGGGRASVEVMGSGTPIIGHQNYHSSVLSCTDIIYPEAFFWRNPEELYEYLGLLNEEKLIEHSAFSRMHYEKYHTPQVFIKCLDSLQSENNIIYPSPLKEYFRDELQVFLDDMSISKLELERSQSQLQQSQDTISGMERSIFWKLRNIWFKFKNFIKIQSKERK
jgi:hypothetical protein